jgi:hypothetical protein
VDENAAEPVELWLNLSELAQEQSLKLWQKACCSYKVNLYTKTMEYLYEQRKYKAHGIAFLKLNFRLFLQHVFWGRVTRNVDWCRNVEYLG